MPYTSAQRPSGESSFSHDLEMKTPDGVALRATLREPEAHDGPEPLPTLVFAHAMFARRSEWERPRGQGLAALYADRGFRTLSFDFRGHGDSTGKPGGSDYDAYVRHDLPTVVSCAKDRGGKVIVIGHSLGGHVALASQGAGFLGADALVVAGANVWHETLEPSRARFAAQRLAAGAMSRIVRTAGKFPARALRMGSDDAPPGALSVFLRTPESGAWTSDDGEIDYFACLTRVDVPVCAIVSRGDRFICRPTCGERFVGRVRGPKKVHVVERADDGGPAPDHMGLVTSLACRSHWYEAIAWALGSA
jgi:pimeloyl-ACP methyl ester carboxylesterase